LDDISNQSFIFDSHWIHRIDLTHEMEGWSSSHCEEMAFFISHVRLTKSRITIIGRFDELMNCEYQTNSVLTLSMNDLQMNSMTCDMTFFQSSFDVNWVISDHSPQKKALKKTRLYRHFSTHSMKMGITRHVNLSVLCLTCGSPRVCLVCLFWALKRRSGGSGGYRLTEYLLKPMIDKGIFVKWNR
jgi:hypothetical protein